MRKMIKWCVCCFVVFAFMSVQAVLAENASKSEAKTQQFKPKEVKIDRDFDGVPERTEVYDEVGIIIRTETDTDGDTKIDEWVFFKEGKPVKAEKDTNGDGKPDTWITY